MATGTNFKGSAATQYTPEAATAIGTMIGAYQIVASLGKGAMGEVFEVEKEFLSADPDIAAENQHRACKVLNAELAAGNQEAITRFLGEMKIAAAVKSPRFTEIYEAGYHPASSCYYLIMELLPKNGETLHKYLERVRSTETHALSVDEAVEIARQLAEGLQVAHTAGVVHRDLKPENICITRDQAGRIRLKMFDFGISKALSAEVSQTLQGLTREGMVYGTACYMSPEQASGGAVDHRADIYALGVILYEMLAGETPFTGADYAKVLLKQLREDPTSLGEIRDDIPPALATLVSRMLAREPANRPQSMNEVLAGIKSASSLPFATEVRWVPEMRKMIKILRARPSAERPPSVIALTHYGQKKKPEARKGGGWVRPEKSQTGLIIGLVLLLVALGLGAFLFMRSPATDYDALPATPTSVKSVGSSNQAAQVEITTEPRGGNKKGGKKHHR